MLGKGQAGRGHMLAIELHGATAIALDDGRLTNPPDTDLLVIVSAAGSDDRRHERNDGGSVDLAPLQPVDLEHPFIREIAHAPLEIALTTFGGDVVVPERFMQGRAMVGIGGHGGRGPVGFGRIAAGDSIRPAPGGKSRRQRR